MEKIQLQSNYSITSKNRAFIEEFVSDFRIGRNVSMSKGGRSEATLRKNAYRMYAL